MCAKSHVQSDVVSLGSLPSEFFQRPMMDVASYVVGFIKPSTDAQVVPELIGSGTLVATSGRRAILTAEHVLRKLMREIPQGSRLGLLLDPNMPRITISMNAVSCVPLARGKLDAEGPDLGVMLLSEAVAGSIAAIKRFYSLSAVRDFLLHSPPDRHSGFWFVNGFPATEAVRTTDGDSEIIRFLNLSGAGGPEEPVTRGEYDYYKFPVPNRASAPESFGGMSGGGFWQIRLRRKQDGTLETLPPLLSGVVFYQVWTPSECALLCHGRRSVYEIAYQAIESGKAP